MLNKQKILFLSITSLIVTGCNKEPITNPLKLIENTNNLTLLRTAYYSDGGSRGWIFNTDQNRMLLVFLPVQFDKEGHRTNVTNSSQTIQLTLNERFKYSDLCTLKPKSDIEFQLIKLIAECAKADQDEDKKILLSGLIEVICERNFDWRRKVKKSSNQHMDFTVKPPVD